MALPFIRYTVSEMEYVLKVGTPDVHVFVHASRTSENVHVKKNRINENILWLLREMIKN